MARFLHEEGLHLPSSQLADWQLMEGGGGRVELDFGLISPSQAHALPQLHLWARSLWLWVGCICSL